VIAGRVPASLHQKIKQAAKVSGRSMSEELAWRAEQSFQSDALEHIRRRMAALEHIRRGMDAVHKDIAEIGAKLLKETAERNAQHETRIAELERAQQLNEETLYRIVEAAVARALVSRKETP
jgi:hypothetical protein